ncbi:MAG: sulfate permease [Lachnospiraceae bacterium]|nr:sulfate permease [Lachnospiraceae bacterium]
MEKLKPKLFSVMKTYTKEQFVKDVISGIIVAIIALPLSIALAIASNVPPQMGIYTAIFGGFIISFLGGSRVQIAGPTAAFATIIAGIVAEHDFDGLFYATIIAGILLVIMGLCRMGSLIKYIPYTITTGFTAGIAVTIAVGQIKDFLGLTYPDGTAPAIETFDKLKVAFENIATFQWQALLVGAVSLIILIVLPKFLPKVPASLVAVLVSIAIVQIFKLDNVNTIKKAFDLSREVPHLTLQPFSFMKIKAIIPDAFTIAILAAIESLLSCVVADSMVNSKHRSNMELIAQGAGNIVSALFGGIPATGAIARTAANIKNGGRTPIAGMVHSIVLLLVLVLLMPAANYIPMPTIAAILIMVAYNMSGWKAIVKLLKSAPKSDIFVLLVTFVLTVVFDLVVAIEVGMILTCILFMKRMSDVTNVESWKYIEDDNDSENDVDSIDLREVPKNTLVYELSGPLFFGAADKILGITIDKEHNCVILRMRSVNAIDATAMRNLEIILERCKKEGLTLILSHVNEQPMKAIKKSGFYDLVGEENICPHIDDALHRAAQLMK